MRILGLMERRVVMVRVVRCRVVRCRVWVCRAVRYKVVGK